MKEEKVFLQHILESIENVEKFSRGLTKKGLIKSRLKQSAIIREIEIIGEATKNLSIGFTNKFPYVEWNKIAGMRDKLIHNYFGVDLDKIWGVIKKDLSLLKKEIKNILKDLNEK
ncbi:DUF86 domain-containing protein [Candidatus Pacearchaeota archaeon]|nr:DUF86 domain-containing protein [Candidatus Pacearchaeota archaeon]